MISARSRKPLLAATVSVAVLAAAACTPAPPPPSPTAKPQPTATNTPLPAIAKQPAPASPSPAAVAPSPSPVAAPSPAPAVAKPSPVITAPGGEAVTEADVRRMANAFAAARSFRVAMTGESEGRKMEMTMEVVRPDRERFRMSAEGQTFEVVRIGNTAYTNIAGQWMQVPANDQASMINELANPEAMVQGLNEISQQGGRITKGRVRTVGNVQCQDWQITAADPDENGVICVGLADFLPREFTAANGSVTMTYSDWDAPINITAPV